MEFSRDAMARTGGPCRQAGLIFLSTPFSFEAVELLDDLGMPAWKVGSGEVTNLPMLERMARTGRPVLISSGMADFGRARPGRRVRAPPRAPVAVLQCTTAYPCPPEKIGLNVIGELRRRYRLSGGTVGSFGHDLRLRLAAVALGANCSKCTSCCRANASGPT